MRLLNLDGRVKDYLIDNVISEGHGRALLGIENFDTQYLVSQRIIDEGLNVRQTEDIVRSIAKGDVKKEKETVIWEYNQYYEDIKGKLENYFGTKVSFNTKKNKNKIEIEFYSDDDLQRIIEILKL
jgi:Predicted transcriptional regulators